VAIDFVYVIGLDHDIQLWPQDGKLQNVQSEYQKIISDPHLATAAVFEEAKVDQKTIASVFCSTHEPDVIPYFNIEMPPDMRKLRGIPPAHQYLLKMPGMKHPYTDAQIEQFHSSREEYMISRVLEKLPTEQGKGALVICGAEHLARLGTAFVHVVRRVFMTDLRLYDWYSLDGLRGGPIPKK